MAAEVIRATQAKIGEKAAAAAALLAKPAEAQGLLDQAEVQGLLDQAEVQGLLEIKDTHRSPTQPRPRASSFNAT